MSLDVTDSTFRDALSQLQGGAQALPWTRRRELGRALGEAFSAGTATDAALELTHRLAADPKWEVRSAVADLLNVVPDADFRRIVARLADDSNAYVRRAVKRTVERRRKEDQAAGRARRSANQVEHHLRSIEAEFGKEAATKSLRMCERFSDLLIGSMVHDIRSILTHLKTDCHAIMEETACGGNSRSKRLTARVQRSFEFLEAALTDMEAFARALPTDREPQRLAALVGNALELAQNNVRREGFDTDVVRIELAVSERIVVEVAPSQVTMSLSNVIKNAYESFVVPGGTLRPGTIHIEATCMDGLVTIVVRDDGMGISPDESHGSLLFTPGRRNKSKRHSTGYGLPIAMRNFTAHGGSLTLESRENEGTTVTMTLPLPSQ
jgi:signal transduction histidine kinase